MKRMTKRALALLVLTAGCANYSSFVATDQRAFYRAPTHPTVYVDRLPEVSFESIGVIEVRAPSGSSLDWIVQEAARKGGEVGCDLVVERSIYRVTYGIAGARAVVATSIQMSIAPPMAGYNGRPPKDRRQFICGITTRT
jgi:hypothetical protein